MRTCLPYGLWTCEDGREVIFNRDYRPIWQRNGGSAWEADSREQVPWVEQRWFLSDIDGRKQQVARLERILDDFITGRPLSKARPREQGEAEPKGLNSRRL